MIRRPRAFPGAHLFISAALAAVATLLVAAAPARAGIGNPIKKMKEKTTQKVEPAAPQAIDNDTVVFDDVVLELTDARVDRIVGAFKAAKAAGAGRAEAAAKLDKANGERGALWEKHGEKIMELQRKRYEIKTCLEDGYREAQDRKTQEYSQKALTDPAIRDKFARAAMESNAAAARGDSAAIQRINATIFSETLISRADSAEIEKKCGPMPPPTPPEGQVAALDKEIAAQREAIRAIDLKVAETQSKEVGMTREQFAMASERIEMYRAWKKSKSKQAPKGFTDEEIKAIEKRLEEIEASWNL